MTQISAELESIGRDYRDINAHTIDLRAQLAQKKQLLRGPMTPEQTLKLKQWLDITEAEAARDREQLVELQQQMDDALDQLAEAEHEILIERISQGGIAPLVVVVVEAIRSFFSKIRGWHDRRNAARD